jgi:pilus assembly protein Flp/PilA
MFIKMLAFKEARIQPVIESFKKDMSGATAIEYGLIAGGISLVIVAAVFAFGGSLSTVFTKMKVTMSSAAGKVK